VAEQAVLEDDVDAPAPRAAARTAPRSTRRALPRLGKFQRPAPRLSRRERQVLVAVVALALAATAIAWVLSTVATTSFFGGGPSPREEAVAAHDVRAAVWALATPLCAWIVLRRDRWAFAGAATWIVLLAVAAPWWWPDAPQHAVDTERPVWQHGTGFVLWALVAAFAAVAVWCAWRQGSRALRGAATLVVLALLVGGVAVRMHLGARADGDRPADSGLVSVD
jgi:hypothetical protein